MTGSWLSCKYLKWHAITRRRQYLSHAAASTVITKQSLVKSLQVTKTFWSDVTNSRYGSLLRQQRAVNNSIKQSRWCDNEWNAAL